MYKFYDAGGQKLSGTLQVDGTITGVSAIAAVATPMAAYHHSPPKPPVPVVLSVDSYWSRGSAARQPQDREALDFLVSPPGPTAWAESYDQGYLRLEYGAYGVTSVRYIDIRSGSYQLPPCHSVRVDAAVYNSGGAASGRAGTVSVSIAPGVVPYPEVALNSGAWFAAAGAQNNFYPIPQGARRWKVGLYPSGAVQATADVQLFARGGNTVLFADWSVPNYVPPAMEAEVMAVAGGQEIDIDKAGTATTTVLVCCEVGL